MSTVIIKVAGPFSSGKTTLLLKYFDAMRAIAGKQYEVRILGEFKSMNRESKYDKMQRIRDELMVSIEFGSDALEILEVETYDRENPESKRIYRFIAGPGHRTQWRALIDIWNKYNPDIFYMIVDGKVLIEYLDTFEDFRGYLRREVWADYMTPIDIQYLRKIKGCVGILINKLDLIRNTPTKLAYMDEFLNRFIDEIAREYPGIRVGGKIISLRELDTYKHPLKIADLPCTPYIRLILAEKEKQQK